MTVILLRTVCTTAPFHSPPSSILRFRNHQDILSLASTSARHTLPLLPKYRRHASTAAPSSTQPTLSRSKVNGPSTTLPPALVLPTRSSSQSFFPYALSLGKAYLTFYKTGVKSIYTNFRAARPIQAVIDHKYHGKLAAAIEDGYLTRSDFQLLTRNWFDVKRVPVFALLFLVCGEFTPLVVVALSGVVPWTCRIPKQVESDRRKLERRREVSFRNLTVEPPKEKGVNALKTVQLAHISLSLGLSSRLWDWVGGLPALILRRKVQHRLEYLEMDDILIVSGGGIVPMNIEELKMACVNRGIDVLGKSEAQLRAELNAWLRSRDKVPVTTLLLTRPSVWPARPKVS